VCEATRGKDLAGHSMTEQNCYVRT
jgi:hypothetical protein